MTVPLLACTPPRQLAAILITMAPRTDASSESDAEMLDSDVEYTEKNDDKGKGKGKGKAQEKKGKAKEVSLSAGVRKLGGTDGIFVWVGRVCLGGELYAVLGPGAGG